MRVGNAASEQFQLDVYGEVIDALYQARVHGLAFEKDAWELQTILLEYLETRGASPTRGSGRCAASAATSSTRR